MDFVQGLFQKNNLPERKAKCIKGVLKCVVIILLDFNGELMDVLTIVRTIGFNKGFINGFIRMKHMGLSKIGALKTGGFAIDNGHYWMVGRCHLGYGQIHDQYIVV